jgi:hypothetical protein
VRSTVREIDAYGANSPLTVASTKVGFPPRTGGDLLKGAGDALREEGQAEDNVIKEIIATTAEGASEYVGLVPTCISALLTGFAVLRELQRPLWATILYVIFLGVISILMIKLLKGLSYHAIADKPKEFFRGRITRIPKQMISYTIYFLNSTLILLALVVF